MGRVTGKPFDYDFYIQRNKEVALKTFGQLMDENRSIAGTDYYFDELWRLRKKGGSE